VELELPRHLLCAACEGGGCDTCGRSGAVTLRERGEPPDMIEVALPHADSQDVFVIRLPGRGGVAPAGSGLPRGHLLLRIEPSDEPDASVSLAIQHPEIEAVRRAVSEAPAPPPFRVRLLVAALVVSAILLAVWLLSRH
jgi:hypothetical protein